MHRVVFIPIWIEAVPGLAVAPVPAGPAVRFAVVDRPAFYLVKELAGPARKIKASEGV